MSIFSRLKIFITSLSLLKKVLLVSAALFILVASIAGLYFLNTDHRPVNNPFRNNDSGQNILVTDPEQAGKQLSSSKCTGSAKPQLTHLPMDPQDFAFILPYGLMVGGHVTPVDHQYFSPINFNSPVSTYNVYAMADSLLVDMQTRTHMGQGVNKDVQVTDYRLIFSISCRLFYYYDLINSLTPGLESQFHNSPNGLEVKSGQLIGKIGGQTLDFAVWDTDKTLTGFLVPQHYISEPWKIHTADPLDYYAPDIKAIALSKYIRTAEPISGKIDYDIDGKLSGTWFQVGTNGYGGTTTQQQSGYWVGHLAIAPYYLDPSGYIFSIGNWPGEASQFAALESSPDPTTVGVETGLVKYDLVGINTVKADGQNWDGSSYSSPLTLKKDNNIQGCMLVQMTAARSLKGEAFKGKACKDVTGFTANATIYER